MVDSAPDDELLNRVTWKIPNALALVGSSAGDERNAMTTSWITQLSMEPVLIGVGVDNRAVTHRSITEGGCVHRQPVGRRRHQGVRQVLQAGRPTTATRSTAVPFAAATTGAPVFDEAVAWLDCEVRHTLDLGTPHAVRRRGRRTPALNDDEARPASMNDTRMKYGGVKRH